VSAAAKGARAAAGTPGRKPGGGPAGSSGTSSGNSSGRAGKDPLGTYRRKRDFARTAEPSGDEAPGTDGAGAPSYVIQIHDASSLHFDFRLEVDGVLKSWAVPKGPSDDPHDKRLAMPTEDHPMAYRDFEGVIEAGEYGGGTVIVWDAGRYRNASTDRSGREIPFAEALRRGHASFRLFDGKLHGRWSLTRFRKGEGEPDESGHAKGEAWLLVRSEERGPARRAGGTGRAGGSRTPAAPARRRGTPDPGRARSIRTGRTLRQVARAGGPVWHSDR
jgi:bifunctional non-homologous end joining protein LigD